MVIADVEAFRGEVKEDSRSIGPHWSWQNVTMQALWESICNDIFLARVIDDGEMLMPAEDMTKVKSGKF